MLLFDAYLYPKPRGLGVFVREAVRSLSDDIAGGKWIVLTRVPIREIPAENQRVVRWRGGQVSWEQFVVPWFSWRLGAAITHAPANSFGVPFTLIRKPIVVTVHDLMFMRNQGGSIKQKIGNLYRKACYRTLPFCRCTISTVSDASRVELENSLGRDVHVTPNSCQYVLDVSNASGTLPASLAGQDKKHFVHIGGLTTNKNTRRVIEAWNTCQASQHDQLVLLGDTKENYETALPQIKEIPSIVVPGVVSEEQLVAVIKSSRALIFPSLEEGFGLPIVEAAFLGIPVITSNRPPMNQLAPECSLLIDPESTTELAEAMDTLSYDDACHRLLTNATADASKRFDRIHLGQALKHVYTQAASQ
ncbi:glycosyltransferase family 4 protein [Novipirellula sp. SH528]|uniref:glycosyltransferase family 4 protein n=1 Tax=Novipirellula sp. SH528 TaxID=3454466 RepID=UPI003FA084FA